MKKIELLEILNNIKGNPEITIVCLTIDGHATVEILSSVRLNNKNLQFNGDSFDGKNSCTLKKVIKKKKTKVLK